MAHPLCDERLPANEMPSTSLPNTGSQMGSWKALEETQGCCYYHCEVLERLSSPIHVQKNRQRLVFCYKYVLFQLRDSTLIVFVVLAIKAVIKCQSIARQNFARSKLDRLRHEHRTAYVTVIQAKWRCFLNSRRFALIVQNVINIQSTIRKWIAQKFFAGMMTDIITCQSIARRRSSLSQFKVAVFSATSISKIWRGYLYSTVYQQTLEGVYFHCIIACHILLWYLTVSICL